MHAFLIVGNNSEMIEKEISRRMSEWKISPWDIVHAYGAGIADIRDFRRELSIAPRGTAKAGIIEHIELLTPEAQNALLKTLEEPPPHTYIIGTTGMPEALLPTILSRMSVVKLAQTAQSFDSSLLLELLHQSPGKRLATLEPFLATRDDAKKFVSELLCTAEHELTSHPTKQLTSLIRNLLSAESQLSVNVNQRLVVDNAVLGIA